MSIGIGYALSRWLAQGDRALELALQYCRFRPEHGATHLAIACPQKILPVVLENLNQMDWGDRALVQSIDFYGIQPDGSERHEASLLPQVQKRVATQPVDVLGLGLLHRLGVNFAHPLAIVEMGSNRSVFCSSDILQQSGAGSLDRWMDQDMSRYHYPAGLRILENAYAAGGAREVQWIAKTFQGDRVQITANVYAGQLNGRPVRVTEGLHCQRI